MIISSRPEPTSEKNCQRAADLGDKPSVTATEGAIASTSLACPLTQRYNTIPAAFTSGLTPDLGLRDSLRMFSSLAQNTRCFKGWTLTRVLPSQNVEPNRLPFGRSSGVRCVNAVQAALMRSKSPISRGFRWKAVLAGRGAGDFNKRRSPIS